MSQSVPISYKYVLRLEPKVKGLPLTRGDWLHQMLMAHYDGEGWELRWQALARQFYNLFEEEREELGDLPGETRRIMLSYLRRWKREDREFVVVDSEVDEIITLPNGLEFNFIIDLIVESIRTRRLWLWDHKSVKNFFDEDFKLLDAQLTRYFYGAQKLGYKPLAGAVFNEIRTKPPAIPQSLKSGGLSQRANIDTDLYTYQRALREKRLDPTPYAPLLRRLAAQKDRFFRRSYLPKDRPVTVQMMREAIWSAEEMERAEAQGKFPRTVTKDCKWDCVFLNLCQTELLGGDPSSIIKHDFRTRRRPE